MLNPSKQPINLETFSIAKEANPLPVSLNILSRQKMKRLSRKTFNPVILSSTLIEPAPFPAVKSSSLNGAEKTISC